MLIWIGARQGQLGIPGIPARDLTDDEVQRHGGEAELLKTGLWEKPAAPAKTSKRRQDDVPQNDKE